MKRFWCLCQGLALFLALWSLFVVPAVSGSSVPEPPDPDAAGLTPSQRQTALVARSAWEHARLETLEAAFIQRKSSAMLLEPEESQGVFSYRSPDLMRWDFVPSEGRDNAPLAGQRSSSPMTVIIRDQSMITWYRDLGRAERVDIGRRADKILKLLGPGASLADLEGYFKLNVEFPEAPEEPYRVQLEPRSKRIGRRLHSMAMELDRQLFVPIFLRFTGPDGDTTELRFDQLRVNGTLPVDRFELALPDGVAIAPPT